MRALPKVGFVIPTYNSENTLKDCLDSIAIQNYPKDKIEIIIVDGGSNDKTLEIAKEYTSRIFHNPLRTGEAGKALGVKKSSGEIIALIDSDNILPSNDWLKRMIEPFHDEEIVGSEPLYYTYRRQDGYITRYCALIGMNDPLCLFLGNYDRYSLLTNKWTEIRVKEEDKGNYLKIELSEGAIPTIGANGFLIRRNMFDKCSISDYLFDIDLVYDLVKQGFNKFAKVKIDIIHIFAKDFKTFIKKQRRRIRDYTYYERLGLRKYPWLHINGKKTMKFIVYTMFILPLFAQTVQGYTKKSDIAWFFHIPACWITLVVYALGFLKLFENLRSGYSV